MSSFQLNQEYTPRGDQSQAIAKLVKSIRAGNRHQTLLGVTGSGKTFTMANIIAEIGKPALVFSHNKTLAAQLYSEFKNFFPDFERPLETGFGLDVIGLFFIKSP